MLREVFRKEGKLKWNFPLNVGLLPPYPPPILMDIIAIHFLIPLFSFVIESYSYILFSVLFQTKSSLVWKSYTQKISYDFPNQFQFGLER